MLVLLYFGRFSFSLPRSRHHPRCSLLRRRSIPKPLAFWVLRGVQGFRLPGSAVQDQLINCCECWARPQTSPILLLNAHELRGSCAKLPHPGRRRLLCRCARARNVVIRRLWVEGGDSSAVQDQLVMDRSRDVAEDKQSEASWLGFSWPCSASAVGRENPQEHN